MKTKREGREKKELISKETKVLYVYNNIFDWNKTGFYWVKLRHGYTISGCGGWSLVVVVAGVARLKAPTGRTDCGKTWGAACVVLQLGLGSKESGSSGVTGSERILLLSD